MNFLFNVIFYVTIIFSFNYGNVTGHEGSLNIGGFMMWVTIVIYTVTLLGKCAADEEINGNKDTKFMNKCFASIAVFSLIWHGWIFTAVCMFTLLVLLAGADIANAKKAEKEQNA